MKLTLELKNGKKIVIENKNVDDIEFAVDNLSIEYMWEQLKAKIEAQRNG